MLFLEPARVESLEFVDVYFACSHFIPPSKA